MNKTSLAMKRLKTDLFKITDNPPPGVQASLSNDNLFEWDAVIFGPGDTCFDGGVFRLRMKFPTDYPKNAPTVWFWSRMFHPNVYPNGKICLDILEMKEKWNEKYDAATVLCAIQSMLADPNPESPANGEANSLYQVNVKEYERRVRQIVQMSEEDNDDGIEKNWNVEDEEDELAARVQDLDVSGLQGDPEAIRRFLSQY